MHIEPTSLHDVKLITPRIFEDGRGYFFESYHQQKFDPSIQFVQDNVSFSTQGTLRGLHFQKEPMAQGKYVRAVAGHIYDVAVDIRPDSPTYKQWVGVHLTDKNKCILWIPKGFAHGFYVMSTTALIQYKCTEVYSSDHEGGLCWNDPDIDIQWPLIEGCPVLLSDKDKSWAPCLNI